MYFSRFISKTANSFFSFAIFISFFLSFSLSLSLYFHFYFQSQDFQQRLKTKKTFYTLTNMGNNKSVSAIATLK